MYKAQKALIAAKFNGLKLEEKKFDPLKDIQKPDLARMNPTKKVPYLETDQGCIFTSHAVARYVARVRADTPLLGCCFDDEGEIDTLLDFCTQELEIPLMMLVYPVLGMMDQPSEDAIGTSQKDVQRALRTLEGRLKASFLLGDFVTLADIALVCTLREGFQHVLTPDIRKPYPKVCAWFERCCALPQFKAVLGETKMCSKASAPRPPKFSPAPRGEGKKDKAAPKADKPKEQTAAPAAKAPAEKPKKEASAKPQPAAAAPAGPVDEAAIKAKGDEIRVLKEKLKAEGLSGKKINDHADVVRLVGELNALKAADPKPAAKAEPAKAGAAKPAPAKAEPAKAGKEAVEAEVKAVGDEIRSLKEKLKGEGLSGKKINEHPDVLAKVSKLQELKKQLE